MTGARVAVLLLLAATTGSVCVVEASAASPPLNRCQVAQKLTDAGKSALALEQLKKALNEPSRRDCAVRQIVAMHDPALGPSRCDAASDLLFKDDLPDEAKTQYEKALDDEQDRTCAVTGLKLVATAQDKKKDDDKHVTLGEAADSVGDWLLGIWPWLVLFGALLVGGRLFRRVFPAKRIAVRASKTDEKFAQSVAAAANAAGGQGARSAKVVQGGAESLPQDTITDVSKLLRLPGGVPFAALLRLGNPLPPSTLSVGWSAAGGWAVADLALRRPLRRTLKASVALKLGGVELEKQQEAVSLVAGAWIVGVLAEEITPAPTRAENHDAALADAYFRAGASLQTRSETATALRCYEAMPSVDDKSAPFAWVGARLNTMMALRAEGRSAEATAMADAVAGVAHARLKDAADVPHFGKAELEDLQRRTVYLIAILRVDLAAETPADATRAKAADEAVALLDAEIESAEGKTVDPSLLTAMRMVSLCRRVATAPTAGDRAAVAATLAAELGDAATDAARAPLGAAAYYDAACAYSLIAGAAAGTGTGAIAPIDVIDRLAAAAAAGDPRAAIDEILDMLAVAAEPPADGDVELAIDDAFKMLTLAAAATPESQRSRMQTSAQTDAMLARLREPEVLLRFRTTLGIVSVPDPDARIDISLTETPAAAG
jgi:hypothetical protein